MFGDRKCRQFSSQLSVLQWRGGGEWTGLHLITRVFMMLSILQSQFTEKGFKKTENSAQNVVLLLFLYMLDNFPVSQCYGNCGLLLINNKEGVVVWAEKGEVGEEKESLSEHETCANLDQCCFLMISRTILLKEFGHGTMNSCICTFWGLSHTTLQTNTL